MSLDLSAEALEDRSISHCRRVVRPWVTQGRHADPRPEPAVVKAPTCACACSTPACTTLESIISAEGSRGTVAQIPEPQSRAQYPPPSVTCSTEPGMNRDLRLCLYLEYLSRAKDRPKAANRRKHGNEILLSEANFCTNVLGALSSSVKWEEVADNA
ncbi:hypothetical protein J6590_046402 [Homalodisca vitripennis]|nr:hypothetical protein J6590_046402 [Homalodisca vitripennis]